MSGQKLQQLGGDVTWDGHNTYRPTGLVLVIFENKSSCPDSMIPIADKNPLHKYFTTISEFPPKIEKNLTAHIPLAVRSQPETASVIRDRLKPSFLEI